MFCCCERTLGRKQRSSIKNLFGSYFNAEELKLSANRKPGTFYITGDLRTSKFRVPLVFIFKTFYRVSQKFVPLLYKTVM